MAKPLVKGVAALACLLAAAALLWSGESSAPQRSVVGGVVDAEDLARSGDAVKCGDALIKVRTAAGGVIAAARADADGVITEVTVQPGDKIVSGQTVAHLRR